ncbi:MULTISPECIES: ABC transporter ATP-binding protein [unclassified Bradyrhizobium]|uniref:ABC transporter ATP-binding protein n=1 Tax=unclassified Bradyrhizobium TaxID=2631580 RepID=UPI0028ED293B|nr:MULTISPECIES: ABC transporter ATP-binding protein [unclassified Bradyrhizobium]
MNLLSVRDVSKSFGRAMILSDIALDVKDGEIISLLGPSGSGKSTLLRIIAGLEQPDRGVIQLDGRDVTTTAPGPRGIAMVFQNLALYPHLTARQNIALPLRIRRLSRLQRLLSPLRLSRHVRAIEREIDRQVANLAEKLAIDTQLDKVPARLSGGQRQRVAIGRAIIRESRLLLLDEPLSSLDAKLRVQAREEILELRRNFGLTCIFVTHDQGEALAISDRVAVMLNGRITQFAPPAAIYRSPATLDVARFVGSPAINCIEGVADGHGLVRAGLHTFTAPRPLAAGTRLTVAFRPEHVQIKSGAQAALPGYQIARTEDYGHEGLVHLRSVDDSTTLIGRISAPVRIGIGDHVTVSVSERDIHLFSEAGERLDAEPFGVSHYARA